MPGAALGGGSGSQKLLRAAARGEFRWIWRVQQVPAGFQGCPIVLQPSCPFPSPFCAHLPQERLKFSKGTFQAMCFHFPFGRWAFSASHPTPTALPLAQPVPCSVYLQEILASPSAIAVEFGSWQRIKSNSPALSQIPTNPTCSTGSRACCCGAGALWCHTGGDGTRTRLHIMC